MPCANSLAKNVLNSLGSSYKTFAIIFNLLSSGVSAPKDIWSTIFNEFKSEIGINNSNTQKKERLITSEVENNKEELNSNIYEWYYNLSDCINKVNAMFNLTISVSFNEDVVNVKGETKEVIDNV